MATDQSALLRVTSQEIIDGLKKERGAFADVAPIAKKRSAIKGSEPYTPTASSLAGDAGGVAIGAEPADTISDIASLDWNLLQYSRKFTITEAEIEDLSQYMDPMKEKLQFIKDGVEVALDVDLSALLTNASFNGSHAAAGGVWSTEASTPVLDMQEQKRLDCPESDCAILGMTTAYELSRHPEFKEATSHYTGGGSMGMDAMREGVAQVLNIPVANVFIFGTYYNSANPGQSVSTAYAAGDLFWQGVRRGLLLVEQPGSGFIDVVKGHGTYEVSYIRYAVPKRVVTELGTYMTGL